MATGTHNVTELHGKYNQPYFGFYFQDDYKITSRFTLNLGLRWEYEAPRVEENNQVANFDFTSAATLSNGASVRGDSHFLVSADCRKETGTRTRKTLRLVSVSLTISATRWCSVVDTASSTATVGGTAETIMLCHRPDLFVLHQWPRVSITGSHPTLCYRIRIRRASVMRQAVRPVY